MGQATRRRAFVVLTSDNRGADPLSIINDALVGLRRTDVEHRIEPGGRGDPADHRSGGAATWC
jgi:hypothetical protein